MSLLPDAIAIEVAELGSGAARGEAVPIARCNAVRDRAEADAHYFMGRMHESVARAAASADSSAKLVHYELAGRYSVAALGAGGKQSLDACRNRRELPGAEPRGIEIQIG